MDWTVPPLDRIDPPTVGEERVLLENFLDYHRQTLLQKCSELPGEQLRRRLVEPSKMSLLGLLRHLSEVERSWFRRRIDGQAISHLYSTDVNEDADFDEVDRADARAAYATYLAEVDAAREAASRHGLDDTCVHERTGDRIS